MKIVLLCLIICVAAACGTSATVSKEGIALATMPAVRIALNVTEPPPPTRDLRAVETLTPTISPTIENSLYNCSQPAPRHAARYAVVANVDYASKTIDVAQNVHFYNASDTLLDKVVFSVEANNAAGIVQMGSVHLANSDLSYSLAVNRLEVSLPAPMPSGCEVSLDLTLRLTLPRIGDGLMAYKGYLGYNERQLNLGYWLPTIVPLYGDQWLLHDPSLIGEQVVYEQALWDVTFNVANASRDLTIAAPGERSQPAATQWHFVFDGGRDFTASMSAFFKVSSQVSSSGAVMELFAFPDAVRDVNGILKDGAAHALDAASKAFEQYEALFGKYPFGRVSVVQGDFPDGMEFSGLVFVSTNWFYNWKGGFDNYLTIITVHEVAHQWWYAQVGSDGALAPWLDEALATYSEYIYYEEYHPELRDWWWSTRVGYFAPAGDVDSTIYEFANPRAYINAVYLRGVQMLQNIRTDIGTDAFFDLLAAYAQRGNGIIADPSMFWMLFTADQYTQTLKTREEFFREPDLR